MRIAVAGGTGLVGRFVVATAQDRGHDVQVLARTRGVDLRYGLGVEQALANVDTVVDVSNTASTSRRGATTFFELGTRNLLAGARNAGVRHHLTLSIVGCDRVDIGYYKAKRRQEELVREGTVPWTVLRATQFHEFPAQLCRRAPGPIVPIFVMQTRPVAAREVAERLVDLAEAGPAGDAVEMAGPEVFALPDITRRWLSTRREHRIVVPLRLPGRAGGQLAGGGLLPSGQFVQGATTFDDWLAAQH